MCSEIELNEITSDIVSKYRDVFGNNIVKIYLFGSYARGEQTEYSDIDYVAIVRGDRLEVQEKEKRIWHMLSDINSDAVISPQAIPYDEFEQYKDVLPFYRNIAREGVVISEGTGAV